jgi:adenylate kinase family enzyme
MAPRIAVQGTSGSGKTTVARELARRHGVPHVELDALFHGPGWAETPAEEFQRRVAAATDGDGWVVDGNYDGKLGDLVLGRADTVVWLDLPLRVALSRVTRRTVRRIRTSEELWSGNRESWRGGFFGWESMFVWTIRSHLRHRGARAARLAQHRHLRVVRLRTPAEVESYLARR